jgi:hypothetical protein
VYATDVLRGIPGVWERFQRRESDGPAQTQRRRVAAPQGAEVGRAARWRVARINMFAGAVVLAAAALHAWLGLEAGRLGYELSNARQLQMKLEKELKSASAELAQGMRVEAIEAEAQRRLGVQAPALGQVINLRGQSRGSR